MSKPIAIKVERKEGKDTYSYDGKVHEINGFRRLEIDRTLSLLLTPDYLTPQQLRAHGILWGINMDLGMERWPVIITTLRRGLKFR